VHGRPVTLATLTLSNHPDQQSDKLIVVDLDFFVLVLFLSFLD